jgi:hypothetical protein
MTAHSVHRPPRRYVDHLKRRAVPFDSVDGEEQEAELAAVFKNIRPLLGQWGVLIAIGGQPASVR